MFIKECNTRKPLSERVWDIVPFLELLLSRPLIQLALVPHRKKVLGLNLTAGYDLSALCLQVLPVDAWVFSGCSGLLPQSIDMHLRLIRDSKLSVGENVSINGCFSLYIGPVVHWWTVQGVPPTLIQWLARISTINNGIDNGCSLYSPNNYEPNLRAKWCIHNWLHHFLLFISLISLRVMNKGDSGESTNIFIKCSVLLICTMVGGQ